MKKSLFLTFTTATTIIGLLSLSFPEVVVGDGCCALTKPPGSKEEDYYCINPTNMKTQRCITAKVATARWMAQNLEWGTLSTLRTDANGNGINGDITPFGNTYSFSDGPCGGGTGTPYFYGTDLDVSWNEAAENPMVSFALSEASLTSDCVNRTDDGLSACVISASGGDPEAPPCARLTLVGNFTNIPEGTAEHTFATKSLFERHPAMASWPTDHAWLVAKIDVQYVWTIDFYGGANVFTADQYYGSNSSDDEKKSEL